jgi:hypothetical protein
MTTVHEERVEAPPEEAAKADYSTDHPQRSLASLLRELRDEAVTLIQQELALARSEISHKVSQAQRAAASSVGGVALLLAGLITICAAASAGLYVLMLELGVGPEIALWAAPLAVGIVVLLIGWAMAAQAKKVTSADHWRPERTERSVRETKQWAERKL